VLASDIPANLEVGLSAGHYFSLGNIQSLANQIVLLTRESQTMVERESIRVWVTQRYDWQNIASKTLKTYVDSLSKR
jgi:glycosyltransferase involved in cell wall biosynthesis